MTPYDEAWKVFVEKFNMPVISVEYRLMPENPYPTPHNDCLEVFEYIYNNAEKLGFDKSKILFAATAQAEILLNIFHPPIKETEELGGRYFYMLR